MESVAAVGVAAAALQFFDVAVKATALCRQIRDNAESATDYNRELETSESVELLRLLEEMRRAGKNPSTAKNFFRAIKDRRRVEKLEKSLSAKKEGLHEILQFHIWRLSDSQKQEIQKILDRLAEINLATEERVKESTKQITRHLDQTDTAIKDRFAQSDRRASERHGELIGQAQSHYKETRAAANVKMFLQTLFYPEILERQSLIKDAENGTLEWIFNDSEGVISSFTQQYPLHSYTTTWTPWDSLTGWLRHDNGVYWINGKAGSGKSTLMARLIDDSRTQNALDHWCGGQGRRQILSHFFWRAGTALQQSVAGLLRSLLYQICSKRTECIEALMRRMAIESSMIHTWTEKSLIRAFHEIVNIMGENRFCVFVDGLDEFTGNYSELVGLLYKLQDHENVKFCVSSRPEVQLSSRLSSCKTLRLQDLNLSDLTRYARLKLEEASFDPVWDRGIMLHESLAQSAEGVFLWLVVVIQSVIRGVEAGDDTDILLERIKDIPQDLDDLFRSMLTRVEKFHVRSLAFYFGAMKIAEEHLLGHHYPQVTFPEAFLTIANFTASMAPNALRSMDSFEEACEKTESQVRAQSMGLLEILQLPENRIQTYAILRQEEWDPEHVWLRVENSTSFTRERQTCAVEYPKVLKYESRKIAWVHRSAYDFVHDPENAKVLDLSQTSSDQVLSRLYSGQMALLLSAPSSGRRKSLVGLSLTEIRLQWILSIMRRLWESYTSVTRQALDRLRSKIVTLDHREITRTTPYWGDTGLPPDWTFWDELMEAGHWDYILENVGRFPRVLYLLFLFGVIAGVTNPRDQAKRVMKRFGDPTVSLYKAAMSPSPEARLAWLICKAPIRSGNLPYSNTRDTKREQLASCAALVHPRLSCPHSVDQEARQYLHEAVDRLKWHIEMHEPKPQKYRSYLCMRISVLGFLTAPLGWWMIPQRDYPLPRIPPVGVQVGWYIDSETPFETGPFVNFGLGQDTINYMFQHLIMLDNSRFCEWIDGDGDGVPGHTSCRLCASIEELETCHRMIINDFQAKKQDLDASEQILMLEYLEKDLWNLLKEIWQEDYAPVTDTDSAWSKGAEDCA
ncbi:hypothetical protein PG999_007298 [Apiospora kogelbergensis]|uniref:NACHT domain-containing protein n=1 Tax=Apiospora kogelbergensis TaxID=1337665 RepID=A0AAW0QXV5_9PEZI